MFTGCKTHCINNKVHLSLQEKNLASKELKNTEEQILLEDKSDDMENETVDV
jgi:hypothetical protein